MPMLGATSLSNGAVVSRTVTENAPLVALPASSVAVHVTIVVPSGNVSPLAAEQAIARFASTASVPVAANVAGAPAALRASSVWLPGTCSTGAVVSWTVIVNDAVLRLPASSVAVQLTGVEPSGNTTPLAAEQTIATSASTASVAAAAANVAGAPVGPTASSVWLPGRFNTGGVVSWTVIVNDSVLRLAAASVAVQLTGV